MITQVSTMPSRTPYHIDKDMGFAPLALKDHAYPVDEPNTDQKSMYIPFSSIVNIQKYFHSA